MYAHGNTNMFSSYLRRQGRFIFAAVVAIGFIVGLQRTFFPRDWTVVVLGLDDDAYHAPGTDSSRHTRPSAHQHAAEEKDAVSANATLGFGAILAVSTLHSPRRSSLLWAANLTGLDIVIPEQPSWTEEDLAAFRKDEDSRINKGSAMAWLGHLNALEWFLGTGLETALIIEDDADWDVGVRRGQVSGAREALREALNGEEEEEEEEESAKNEGKMGKLWKPSRFWNKARSSTTTTTTTKTNKTPKTADTNSDPHFWSNTSTWEILHLGHSPEPLSAHLFHRIHSHPYTLYPDSSIPSLTSLDPKTQELFHNLAIPPHTRLWHRSFWPLGSYAYAVTRASATKLLTHYGTEKTVAWDVALLEACRDAEWVCWTLEPGMFMEMSGVKSVIASVNEGDGEGDGETKERHGEASGNSEESEKSEQNEEKQMFKTVNIRCSARQNGLWVNEEDEQGRSEMVDKVSRGFCPER